MRQEVQLIYQVALVAVAGLLFAAPSHTPKVYFDY